MSLVNTLSTKGLTSNNFVKQPSKNINLKQIFAISTVKTRNQIQNFPKSQILRGYLISSHDGPFSFLPIIKCSKLKKVKGKYKTNALSLLNP